MKYGFVLPYGDARTAANLAREAEAAGWDGFFVWEPVWGIDAWVCLTAAAMVTERIRLGTMLTPLSRMRPWKLASETATLDNLSGGRVILAVGLGAIDSGFEAFGEVTDRRARAELLDEGLEILTGLWAGQPFHYHGKHYQVKETSFLPPPPPVQQPRIPIWVVGAWPSQKSMQRVLRYDGLLPQVLKPVTATSHNAQQAPTAALREMKAYIERHRKETTPFDIVVEGVTPGDKPEEAAVIVGEWASAGATWWLEAMWNTLNEADPAAAVQQRILQGPPRREQG
jgi:alkanesulfonate monooxygenase SsuD/methylene tetrahydromethanopterin reductase-like flavin-dependent oxidoreductase (luciferase family)